MSVLAHRTRNHTSGRSPHLCHSLSSEGSGLQAHRGGKASFPSPAAVAPTCLRKISCLLALCTCGHCKSPQHRREMPSVPIGPERQAFPGVTPDSGFDSHERGCSFLVLFEGVGLKEASFIGL